MTVTVSGFLVGRTATQIANQATCHPGNGATTVRCHGSALALIDAGAIGTGTCCVALFDTAQKSAPISLLFGAPAPARRKVNHACHQVAKPTHNRVSWPASRCVLSADLELNRQPEMRSSSVRRRQARREDCDEHVTDCIMRLWTTASECHR
jgi:hypothetical protein